MATTNSNQWQPPRGIRLISRADRRNRPYAVQWRVDGVRKTKAFETKERQEAFARGMAGDVRDIGVAAYRLDPDEARTWRAFRAEIGTETSLDAVITCWRRHGKPMETLTVTAAAARFLAAKEAEGLADTTMANYRPLYEHFKSKFGARDVASIDRDEIAAYLAGLEFADITRRTYAIRVKLLFRWLKDNRFVRDNPCDGLKPPKVVQEDVQILTVAEMGKLFESCQQDKELAGRLALEAFAGMRHGSAASVVPADIDWKAKGIVLPAKTIKTRRRQFIDGLPDNLWAWLKWSDPDTWTMNRRQLMVSKSLAFTRAKVPHPFNGLRHSFASYHSAIGKDASRTAAILCHTSPKMLYAHYKGRATAADGAAYFRIKPPA